MASRSIGSASCPRVGLAVLPGMPSWKRCSCSVPEPGCWTSRFLTFSSHFPDPSPPLSVMAPNCCRISVRRTSLWYDTFFLLLFLFLFWDTAQFVVCVFSNDTLTLLVVRRQYNICGDEAMRAIARSIGRSAQEKTLPVLPCAGLRRVLSLIRC